MNSGNGVLDVEEPSLADLRTDRVLDSGLAAAFAFGLWTGAFREYDCTSVELLSSTAGPSDLPLHSDFTTP